MMCGNEKVNGKMDKKTKEIAEWFFNLIGYFNHHSFFTKKLWQKVKGFKNVDEGEIKAAFIHKWFHESFNYYTKPSMLGWFKETNESSFNEYIKKFEPLFEAYYEWCNEQR